ncbi:hypothetical protein Anas_14374 [Armadillidium nasatum]|uniref:Uncharacterized protein n=1 Tax=Armadillidium nasatum TaxID=96803 RepID=A0A5N5T8W9_9CRUS|nr:hypothetical protein Anas_14374 [Armadillidium nasatum]
MKILKSKNVFLLMAAFVILICGVVSQNYYNNYDNYYRRVLPLWRTSFRREYSAPALYSRQSRSRQFSRIPASNKDTEDEEYIWPYSFN